MWSPIPRSTEVQTGPKARVFVSGKPFQLIGLMIKLKTKYVFVNMVSDSQINRNTNWSKIWSVCQ
jgi:hypothetical protein